MYDSLHSVTLEGVTPIMLVPFAARDYRDVPPAVTLGDKLQIIASLSPADLKAVEVLVDLVLARLTARV